MYIFRILLLVALCFAVSAKRNDDHEEESLEVSSDLSSHEPHRIKQLVKREIGLGTPSDRFEGVIHDARRETLAQGKGVPWPVIFPLVIIGAWLATAFQLSVDETEASADASFKTFADRLNGDSKTSLAQSKFWLFFRDSEQERRYVSLKMPDLMDKIRVLCVIDGLFAVFYLFISWDHHKDSYGMNPSLSNWTSPATITYNCSVSALIVLLASTMFLTYRPAFRSSSRAEGYVSVLLVVIMMFNIAYLSRWHTAHFFGGETLTLFGSFTNDERLVEIAGCLVLYISLHMPLRFCRAVPICALAPIMYFALCFLLGTAGGDIHGLFYSGLSRKEGALSFDARAKQKAMHAGAAVQSENTTWLCILTMLCLIGQHSVERRQREDFVRMVRSFDLVQELKEEDDAHDDGSTAIGRARKALKFSASGLMQLSVDPSIGQGMKIRVDAIKDELDTAVRTLKDVNKLFEVDAAHVVGEEFADDPTFKAFINANMGGSGAEAGTTRLRQVSSPEPRQTSKQQSNPKAGERYISDGDHVSVQKADSIAKGWGQDWNFDANPLSRKTNKAACIFAGECALIDPGYGERLGAQDGCIRAWVRDIHSRYLPNSYHNEAHACQVTHMAKWFAVQTGWDKKATELQMCALMVGALGHDVGHIGRTNLFCMNAWHSFSMIWNDHAVLENMHAATCFSLMKGDAHIMQQLDPQSMAEMKSCIVRFILATDIKEHHASLTKLKARMEDESFLQKPTDDDSGEARKKFEEDVVIGGETIIKSSDIGQGMMAWAQHKEWSYRVLLEFFEQGDEEKSLGLPVSPLCERKGYNIVGGQGFFIDVLCKSLFQCLVRFSDPNSEGKHALENCLLLGAKNKDLWKEEAAQFYPETLSIDVIRQKFGEAELTTIYPYNFALDKVQAQTTTADNLAQIAEFRNTIFATSQA